MIRFKTLLLLAVFFLCSLQTALAETYPAMAPAEAPITVTSAAPIQTPAPPATSEQVPIVPPRFVRERFDFVGKNQVAELQARLKLTEEILRKYERAYDYRILTVKELQETLKKLDMEKKAEKFRGIHRRNS